MTAIAAASALAAPPHAVMGRGHPHGGPKPVSAFLVEPGRDALTQAFSGREFSPPWHGSIEVAASEAAAAFERLFATPRSAPAIAYIHMPYCQNHCLFCGFFQNVWRPEVAEPFVDDVIAEIAAKAATPLVASAPIEAVYIGGGTPSALPDQQLVRLIGSLRQLLPLTPDCEITLEGRSHGFGVAKAAAVLEAGATRISLGVQTFSTAVRRRLGRKQSGPEVASFLEDLVGLGRASIVCDLIYGLPGQDHDGWLRDIDIANAVGLDGVTLYALNLFPGGPLATAIEHGKLPPAANIAAQARDYAAGVDRLLGFGWRQAYQSHLIRSPHEQNRYNALIKQGSACLPFGPGAGGQAHGYRWRNVIDVEQRRAMLAQGVAPVEGLSRVPLQYAAQAVITAGLEAGRLDLAAVESLHPGFRVAAAPLLANWTEVGLGEIVKDHFQPSRAGAFWITKLTGGFYAALRSAPSAKGEGG
ncbi:heme anaerobic degradation radical SAM methyltransferase ChuW/HutW [Rhodopseudomonas palustris]|uniref:Coproporphyrinogen III oxidase, anaerobic n=1 Tax=Rhodopseudomonas palustris (strain BisB18) TaxID=316056 RepID=Q217A8_RHOPB